MNLLKANRQWAERPDDERFFSLKEMNDACKWYYDNAQEALVKMHSLRVNDIGGNDLALIGATGVQSRFTHWAFGQFCQRVGAPPDFLRSLPADIAQQALNHQILKQKDRDMQLLFHKDSDGNPILRAFNGLVYSRIWDWQVAEYLLKLEEQGWKVPPARPVREGQKGTRQATEEDVLRAGNFGLSVSVGDLIAPAGIYASDHDAFAFMVNNEARVSDGTDEGLGRGFFIENSEVGDGAFVITEFLYRYVCGNHIVWSAEGVKETRIRHTGDADERAKEELELTLKEYGNESVSDLEAQIKHARTFELAATQEEVVSMLFKMTLGVGKKVLEEAYESAATNETENKANPNTVWGIVNGLTEVSQHRPFGDERTRIDRAAGKVMQIAF